LKSLQWSSVLQFVSKLPSSKFSNFFKRYTDDSQEKESQSNDDSEIQSKTIAKLRLDLKNEKAYSAILEKKLEEAEKSSHEFEAKAKSAEEEKQRIISLSGLTYCPECEELVKVNDSGTYLVCPKSHNAIGQSMKQEID
jgi:cysteinyl-tRNA synthetase